MFTNQYQYTAAGKFGKMRLKIKEIITNARKCVYIVDLRLIGVLLLICVNFDLYLYYISRFIEIHNRSALVERIESIGQVQQMEKLARACNTVDGNFRMQIQDLKFENESNANTSLMVSFYIRIFNAGNRLNTRTSRFRCSL